MAISLKSLVSWGLIGVEQAVIPPPGSFGADIVQDMYDSLFDSDGLAQPVTYTPGGTGGGVEILALILHADNPGENIVRTHQGGGQRYLRAEITATVKVTDVAAPGLNRDTLTFNGQAWTVRQVLEGNGFIWRLECDRQVRAA